VLARAAWKLQMRSRLALFADAGRGEEIGV
jgi:hypothetical protein